MKQEKTVQILKTTATIAAIRADILIRHSIRTPVNLASLMQCDYCKIPKLIYTSAIFFRRALIKNDWSHFIRIGSTKEPRQVKLY